MLLSISSGNAVDEVCRALWHFLHWLEEKYDFEIIMLEYARCEDGYRSILLQSNDEKLLALQGTHLWRAQSPFRPTHKRKNWYFTLTSHSEYNHTAIDETKVTYQIMKSPKKGGQHVNTTSSGVRAVYPPLELEAISYDERSQHRNKTIALKRLHQKAEAMAFEKVQSEKAHRWREGKEIKRGNPVKVFEGERFREVKR